MAKPHRKDYTVRELMQFSVGGRAESRFEGRLLVLLLWVAEDGCAHVKVVPCDSPLFG